MDTESNLRNLYLVACRTRRNWIEGTERTRHPALRSVKGRRIAHLLKECERYARAAWIAQCKGDELGAGNSFSIARELSDDVARLVNKLRE